MSTLSTSSRKVSVTLPKLYSWQKDTLDLIEANPGKWFIIKSVRQKSGKTYLLENLLIKTALEKPGSKSFMISPVNSQNNRVFLEISKAVRELTSQINGSTMKITFRNGSTLDFKSAESGDSIRGYTVKNGGILVVDEACYINQEVFEIILPLVSKEHCSLVLASTPDKMSGFFYEMYTKEDSNIISINWSKYYQEMYSEEELEFYRSVYSARRFRTEILGEFIVDGGSVFSGVDKCISPVELIQKGNLVGGIDFGSGQGQDYTVLTFIDQDNQVIGQFSTNDKTPVEQVKWLGNLLRSYRPVRVLAEKNSIGSVYLDMLKSEYSLVTPWSTTNDSKTKIIDRLVAYIEQGKIRFQPQCEELVSELRCFEEGVTKQGKRCFSAPPGKHDDRTMSLAVALQANCSGQYSIS